MINTLNLIKLNICLILIFIIELYLYIYIYICIKYFDNSILTITLCTNAMCTYVYIVSSNVGQMKIIRLSIIIFILICTRM